MRTPGWHYWIYWKSGRQIWKQFRHYHFASTGNCEVIMTELFPYLSSRLALLDILEDRYGNSSVIITSQLPVEAWYNFIDEPTLADAIMDRLTASAHRLPLQGKSMRKKKNL